MQRECVLYVMGILGNRDRANDHAGNPVLHCGAPGLGRKHALGDRAPKKGAG